MGNGYVVVPQMIKPKQIDGMEDLMERVRHLERVISEMRKVIEEKEHALAKIAAAGTRKFTKP